MTLPIDRISLHYKKVSDVNYTITKSLRRMGATTSEIAIGLVVAMVLLGVVGTFALVHQNETGTANRFGYDIEEYKQVDPKLIGYEPVATVDAQLKEPRAIAVGSDDLLYVVGDLNVVVLDPDGRMVANIGVSERPLCVDVAEDGAIFVGFRSRVGVFDRKGARLSLWDVPGDRTLLTAIALDGNDLFLADAGNKFVWHYDFTGKLIGKIGEKGGARENLQTLFVVPSPFFDLAIGPDGLLRVANSGRHRVEVFTKSGCVVSSWGRPSLAIEGFCGCCNPVNISSLSDGFVTVEKGIPRIKVYDADGRFRSVVADTKTLVETIQSREEPKSQKQSVFDVAVDRLDRILVLDPGSKKVTVFVKKKKG